MKTNKFTCDICKQTKEFKSNHTAGYGINDKEQKVCYACCANEDRAKMKETGKAVLYLCTNKQGDYIVTNWPDSLSFKCYHYSIGSHNWGLKRYDVWFDFEGRTWHGVTYGDNTQLCHCKQTKQVA